MIIIYKNQRINLTNVVKWDRFDHWITFYFDNNLKESIKMKDGGAAVDAMIHIDDCFNDDCFNRSLRLCNLTSFGE